MLQYLRPGALAAVLGPFRRHEKSSLLVVGGPYAPQPNAPTAPEAGSTAQPSARAAEKPGGDAPR